MHGHAQEDSVLSPGKERIRGSSPCCLEGSRLPSGLTVGACHCTLVQTQRVSNPKSDPSIDCGLCVLTLGQRGGHPSGGGGRQWGGCACGGGWGREPRGNLRISVLPLFTVNPKQIKSITKPSCQGNWDADGQSPVLSPQTPPPFPHVEVSLSLLYPHPHLCCWRAGGPARTAPPTRGQGL